ncbi:MAG: SMP-30/gluconolactonase/LRE family protein [Phycisphaerae bacterium]|nr:SMP-30/gluconolactonase/LRE family protein [Phycisphaerae bacterium]
MFQYTRVLRSMPFVMAVLVAMAGCMGPSSPRSVQPAIGRSPDEPTWPVLLQSQWGLDVDRDLRNPLLEGVAPAALFRKADPAKPVVFRPLIALGVETTTRAGWYAAGPRAGDLPTELAKHETWAYAHRQPVSERESGQFTPPTLQSGAPEFDPGDAAFGLWVCNEQFADGGVFTQPALVARENARLRPQPYKVMIYPNRDPKSGQLVFDSYLIGWEYSTNDDLQDVITQVDNVRLLPSDPVLPGILAGDAQVRQLATDFAFVEGPAWNVRDKALYFSDVHRAQIIRYADGQASVANDATQQANGLMFTKDGEVVRCENKGRRVSCGAPPEPGRDLITHYDGKRLNSPNDLWLDAAGGIYFTDPRYGNREGLEQDKEAVYYLAADGTLTRIIDNLVRPNGIALSPDGRTLYVVDNGAHALVAYPVQGPGLIGKGTRIANVTQPDGMTVDARGRLFITCRGGVWVLDANGKWLGIIETPEHPANCTFGGPGWKTLFITARTSLYGVETQTRGWHVHLDGPPRQR